MATREKGQLRESRERVRQKAVGGP